MTTKAAKDFNKGVRDFQKALDAIKLLRAMRRDRCRRPKNIMPVGRKRVTIDSTGVLRSTAEG